MFYWQEWRGPISKWQFSWKVFSKLSFLEQNKVWKYQQFSVFWWVGLCLENCQTRRSSWTISRIFSEHIQRNWWNTFTCRVRLHKTVFAFSVAARNFKLYCSTICSVWAIRTILTHSAFLVILKLNCEFNKRFVIFCLVNKKIFGLNIRFDWNLLERCVVMLSYKKEEIYYSIHWSLHLRYMKQPPLFKRHGNEDSNSFRLKILNQVWGWVPLELSLFDMMWVLMFQQCENDDLPETLNYCNGKYVPSQQVLWS